MRDSTFAYHIENARRGLATVAFLKAQFDEGTDRLTMFQPIVEEAIRQYGKDDVDLIGLAQTVQKSTGILIPTEVLKTLLQRARKKNLLTRQGGRFLRIQNNEDSSDLTERMQVLEHAHMRLAKGLRQFAASQGESLDSNDDALLALIQFLDTHHIGIVLDQSIQLKTSLTHSKMDRLLAKFITHIVENDDDLFTVVEDIVKGLIVQNALLMRDIPNTRRHLQQLTVFVDTGVLLRALGYAGPAEKQATCEGLKAIRAAGARLYAFEGTVNEVEHILKVYERNLGSTSGIKSLRPTALTYHFLNVQATPADLRQEITLIREKLSILQIRVREFPKHIAKYTEDEQALAEILRNPRRSQESDDYRIWHDVQAVAAVMTLREGSRPNKILNARHIFASGSSQTVSSVIGWYRESYPKGLEPITHFRSVTNVAWVLRPTDASGVPMRELVTVCSAILQPRPELWSRFVKHLDRLVQSGDLRDDESIEILVRGFADGRLSEFESEDDYEANTVPEMVERVRKERDTQYQAEIEASRQELAESERKARIARREADSARSEVDAVRNESAVAREESAVAREEAILARKEATVAREEAATIKSMLESFVEKLATCTAGIVYAILCSVLVLGAFWTLPMEWPESIRSNESWNLMRWCFIVLFNVANLLGLMVPKLQAFNAFKILKNWSLGIFSRVFKIDIRKDRDAGIE